MSRRLVLCLPTLLFLACAVSWAQVNEDLINREELDAVKMAEGWSEIFSHPFLTALSLGVEKSPEEVLKTLGPVVNRSDAPPLLLALQARAFEASGQTEKSIIIYQQAIERAGDMIGELPWNLHLEFGRLLLLEGQIAKATAQLELAWQVDAYQKRDPAESYAMLAIAYKAEGWTEGARWAIEAAIGCDPMNEGFWKIRASLPLHREELPSDRTTPPWVPAPADAGLLKILWYGHPFSWDSTVKWDGVDAYLEYARILNGAGRINAAGKYVAAAMLRAISPIYATCLTGDPNSCLNSLTALSQDDPEYQKRVPLFIRGYVLLVEFRNHVQLENYLHATAVLEELVDLRGAEYLDEADLRSMAVFLQRKLFAWVSFDSKTGAPREYDPDDFIELLSKSDMKVLKEISGGHDGQEYIPYGMVSPAEDHANVAARILMGYEEQEDVFFSRRALQDLVDTRIRERNFELPVKFLLHDEGYGFLEKPLNVAGDTLRRHLDAALANAGNEIPEQTLIGYAVGCRLATILTRLPENEKAKGDGNWWRQDFGFHLPTM